MVATKRSEGASRSKTQKNYLSTNCSLQLESMKLESLVIVDQHATVNLSTSLVHTARHAEGFGSGLIKWLVSGLSWYYYQMYLVSYLDPVTITLRKLGSE